MAGIRFGVLGPLQVHTGASRIGVAGTRQQLVLAALLLHANQVVAAPALIAAVWDGDPPRTGWRQVQNAVSQLRYTLTRNGFAELHSERAGYLVRLGADQLDLLQFDALTAAGLRAGDAGDPARAAHCLRQALSLWRGPALDGLTTSALQSHAIRLSERRLTVLESYAEHALACGDVDGLVDKLSTAVAQNPLRERLAAMLMQALYRSGRQAEALAAYRQVAATLAGELGVDPGPDLTRTFQQVLRHDPGLDGLPARTGTARMAPAELPADVPAFTGRSAELARLHTWLAARDQRATGDGSTRSAPMAMVISAVSGTAGVGKPVPGKLTQIVI